jgi:SHS2 domain-containing protein
VYRWVDHTAEVEVRIEAPTEAAVFADALAAFAELVGDGSVTAAERREIEVEAEDHETLLAEWLNELVFLADVEQFVPERVSNLELEEGRLHASVRGHRGEPRPIVKAITRHGLELRPTEEGWRARVVFDV